MDFFQDHSLEYLEMALKVDDRKRMAQPDGYGKRIGECGDTVEFFINEKSGRINEISYDIDGCQNTNACANTVVRLAGRLAMEEAWESVTPEAVVDFLKTLPNNETHCAELAVGAFYLALKEAEKSARKKIEASVSHLSHERLLNV